MMLMKPHLHYEYFRNKRSTLEWLVVREVNQFINNLEKRGTKFLFVCEKSNSFFSFLIGMLSNWWFGYLIKYITSIFLKERIQQNVSVVSSRYTLMFAIVCYEYGNIVRCFFKIPSLRLNQSIYLHSYRSI